ncbi:MAG TPA: MopE-related protein, partial [Catalimonadaceae bacterium]|nr:MopE-related protein [Catalimonadaceae bacterium]
TTVGAQSVSVNYTDGNGCAASTVGTVAVDPLPTVYDVSGGGSYCNIPGGGATVNLSGSEIGVNYEFKFTATGTFATVAGTGSSLSVNNVTGVGTVYAVATNASTGCSRNMNLATSVFPETPSTWYQDNDGDNYGNAAVSTLECSQPIGYVANSTDCNDGNFLANPGATEICGNGIDDNCNGATDEGCVLYTFYQDSDGDTYGNPAVSTTSNNPTVPSGYVTNSLDCNDGNPAVNPAASEICNGIDDNCDGTIDNGTPALGTASAIAGPAGVCRNSTGQVFSVNPIPGATSYIWTLPAGATGSSSTNSITLSFSSTYVTGNICVKAANSCLQGANFCRSVTYFSAKPGTPVAIIGSTPGVCGDTRSYSVANVANATSYNWTAPANSTIVSGQGTNTVSVQFLPGFTTGSLSVTASNCKGTSTARTLALSYATGTPASIAGNLHGNCAGSTGTYSCPAVSGATVYTWTVPANAVINSGQGTNSISVTFPNPFTSGTITVKSGTACYTSSARSITVYSVPVAPSSISGTLLSVCGGTTQTYTCPASTTGATSYSWTVPLGSVINSGQGTNSISLTLPAVYSSGTISVVAVNACGNSSLRSVTVRSVPAAPTAINGLKVGACGGSTQTYSCAASTTGATSFTWSAPAGSVINSGQGTNTVSITLPSVFTSGSVSVVAGNACGNSTTYSTTVRSIPTTPGTISGQTTNLCGGGTFTYSIAAVAGATGYTWTPAAGCSIVTNLGNSITMSVPSGFTTGTLSVIASNACGNSTAKTLALTRLPSTPGTITGPTAVCPLQTGLTYSVAATAGLTYTWTMPGTGSIQSGQGTNAISATWGSAAGSVVVKANNACGSSGNRTLAVALNACRPALDQELTPSLSLYPNPGTGKFSLSAENLTGKMNVSVYNMLGTQIAEFSLEDASLMTEFNISEQPAGVYLVKFQSGSFRKDLKVIKQ